MRETDVEELFAGFEADTVPTFRPPGVADARRRTRRRRRHRGTVAAVLALLVAGPAGSYAVAGRGGDRSTPGPVVSPAAAGAPVDRAVTLPGAAGRLAQLRFVDARQGWALFDTCDPQGPAPTDCRRSLGRTVDGGSTWQPVALPGVPSHGSAYLRPIDERTLLLEVGERLLVSTDGGANFTNHPADDPPVSVRRLRGTASGFTVECPPGAPPASEPGLECDRMRLVRVGGSVPRQPPLTLATTSAIQLVEGRDGRLWMAVTENGRTTVAVTGDGAGAWRKLPAIEGHGFVMVPPDGTDVWLARPESGSVWQLVDNRWQRRPDLPGDAGEVAAAGGGMLAVVNDQGDGGWWLDGRHGYWPELRGSLSSTRDGIGHAAVEVLADGTLVFSKGATWLAGVGTGTTRTWTRFS